MSLYEKFKQTGSILEPVIEKPKETGFLKKTAQFLFPKSLEYKFGVTPRPGEVTPIETPKFESLYEKYQKTVAPVIAPSVAPPIRPPQTAEEYAKALGLPKTELRATPPEVPEKDTLFKKALRFVLPKSLEVKWGLRKPTTAEDIVQWGKDVEEYYGRGEDLVGGVITFGKGLLKLNPFKEEGNLWKAALLKASQGYEGASAIDKDWADRYVKDADVDFNKFVQEVYTKYKEKKMVSGLPFKITDLAEFPQNLVFSLISMGTGLGVGVPIGLVPLPGFRVAAWTLGTAASGAVAYQMTSYEIMQQYLELENEEKIAKTGEELTLEEEKHLKDLFGAKAMEYGLWEALPEAISNLAFIGILTAPLSKMIGKSMAGKILTKITGMYGEELLTETVTQKGQSDIEVEAGLREGKIGWIEAFKEIAPQTFLLTTVMAGAGTTIIKTSEAVKRIKASLKSEIGEDHSLYKEFETKIPEEIEAGKKEEAVLPEVPKPPVVEIPKPVPEIAPKPLEAIKEAIPTPKGIIPKELAREAIPPFEKIKDWRTKIGNSTITKSWVSADGENFVNVKLPSGRDFNVKYDILIGKEKPINTQQISDLKDLMIGEQRLGITDIGVNRPAVGKMVEDFKLKSPSVMKRPIVVVADGKGGLRIEEGQHRFAAAKIAGVEPPMVLLTEKQLVGLNALEVDALARKVYKGKNTPALTDFYAQAVKGVKEVKPEIPIGKVAAVAKSIEAKAIEQGLTKKGFDKLAEYSPAVIKEQSQIMSDIMSKNIELAKRIATGKEVLPERLKGTTALSAMEDYAMETKDGQLALELANSPIATEISVAGQTLRLAAERTPDSATAKIREIAKEREKVAEKKLKGKATEKAKSEIKDSLNKKMEKEKSKISKYNWESFIDSIAC